MRARGCDFGGTDTKPPQDRDIWGDTVSEEKGVGECTLQSTKMSHMRSFKKKKNPPLLFLPEQDAFRRRTRSAGLRSTVPLGRCL